MSDSSISGAPGADGFIDLGQLSMPPMPPPESSNDGRDWSDSEEEMSPLELMEQMKNSHGNGLLSMIKKQEYKLPDEAAEPEPLDGIRGIPCDPTSNIISSTDEKDPFDFDVDKEMAIAEAEMKKQMDDFITAGRAPLALSGAAVITADKRLEMLGKAAQEQLDSSPIAVQGGDGILDPVEFAEQSKGGQVSEEFVDTMRASLAAVTADYSAGKSWRDEKLEGDILDRFQTMRAPPADEMDAGATEEKAKLDEMQKHFNDQFDRRSGYQKPDTYKPDGDSSDEQ